MRRASGCLFGMAYGDALGAITEFMDFDDIVELYGPLGLEAPRGNPATVTDDTQMALAVGEALMDAAGEFTPSTLEYHLRRGFVQWCYSKDNDRSPGMTCLTACHRLQQEMPWQRATVLGSKGCGANMRVQPVGLIDVSESDRSAIAQFQAALTHGHPTGLAAADLTAATIAWLIGGAAPVDLPTSLRAYCHAQRHVYYDAWLGDLWERPGETSAKEFIARGWDECLEALDNLDLAMANPNPKSDPCRITGAGWVAEEAFATALLCFLLFPNDPVAVIRHAAVSSGDSDSIACIAGAFAGAYCGFDAWPAEWAERIEYSYRLDLLGKAFD